MAMVGQALLSRFASCSAAISASSRPGCSSICLGPASMRGFYTMEAQLVASHVAQTGLQRHDNAAKKRFVVLRAGGSREDFSPETDEYVEAIIDNVKHTDKYGHVIYLKLKDGNESVLPVYIGDFECAALIKEIKKRPTMRPMTHDMMKNALELLGYKVSRVRVTALVGNTYHARIHFLRISANGATEQEVDVDARPSDAINLAVRFNAPVLVNKSVAERMAHSVRTQEAEPSNELVRSCREEMLHIKDPTMMLKLQLQVAVTEERYEDARRIHDAIEQMLSTDRALTLVVALESALDGQRYEEAALIRDELRKLRGASGSMPSQTQGDS